MKASLTEAVQETKEEMNFEAYDIEDKKPVVGCACLLFHNWWFPPIPDTGYWDGDKFKSILYHETMTDIIAWCYLPTLSFLPEKILYKYFTSSPRRRS